VANYADSGESSGSFLSNRALWPTVSPLIKSGDYVLIQLGHNDKQTAKATYESNLTKLVTGVKGRGGIPVLVTQPVRRLFSGNQLTPTGLGVNGLGVDLPASVRAVAKAQGIALIDLSAKTKTLVESLGPTNSGAIYLTAAADGVTDRTHFSAFGADQLAKLVIQGATQAGLTGITSFLR
jgi:lysophospholipase L1-like esterase